MTILSSIRLFFNVIVACLGLFQFGYHISELNAASGIITCEVSRGGGAFSDYLDLPWCIPMAPELFAIVTGIYSIGGLLGSLVAGHFADTYGRRKTAMGHAAVFVAGLLITALSLSFYMLMFGRFTSGMAAGLALVVTPLMINELSPVGSRGFFGSLNQILVNLGIALTAILGLFSQSDLAWRYPMLFGAGIGLFHFFLLMLCVELPVWIARQGSPELAHKTLFKVRGGAFSDLVREVVLWDSGAELSDTMVPLSKYLLLPEYRNSLVVTTGILVLQQFTGINSIVLYGANTLSVPFPNQVLLLNCFLQVLNLFVTLVAATVVDRVGRKPLLQGSALFLAVGSVLIGWGIWGDYYHTLIYGLCVYIVAFALGLGPIPFLLVSEVTQPRARALAQSWGMATNWFSTFMVAYLFPLIGRRIGCLVYLVFGCFCVATYVFTLRCVPETMGKSTYAQVWGIHPIHD